MFLLPIITTTSYLGNQTINKANKELVKKLKKRRAKTEKRISNVTDVLESFSFGAPSQDYDFNVDFGK